MPQVRAGDQALGSPATWLKVEWWVNPHKGQGPWGSSDGAAGGAEAGSLGVRRRGTCPAPRAPGLGPGSLSPSSDELRGQRAASRPPSPRGEGGHSPRRQAKTLMSAESGAGMGCEGVGAARGGPRPREDRTGTRPRRRPGPGRSRQEPDALPGAREAAEEAAGDRRGRGGGWPRPGEEGGCGAGGRVSSCKHPHSRQLPGGRGDARGRPAAGKDDSRPAGRPGRTWRARGQGARPSACSPLRPGKRGGTWRRGRWLDSQGLLGLGVTVQQLAASSQTPGGTSWARRGAWGGTHRPHPSGKWWNLYAAPPPQGGRVVGGRRREVEAWDGGRRPHSHTHSPQRGRREAENLGNGERESAGWLGAGAVSSSPPLLPGQHPPTPTIHVNSEEGGARRNGCGDRLEKASETEPASAVSGFIHNRA